MKKIKDFTTGIELLRGFDWVDIYDENEIVKWPRCHVDSCPNGICVGLSKKYCHPHLFSKGMESVEELETAEAYAPRPFF